MINLTTPVSIFGKPGIIVTRSMPVNEEPLYDIRLTGEAKTRRYLTEAEFKVTGDPMPEDQIIREEDIIHREREARARLDADMATRNVGITSQAA